jgi:DNA primase
MLITHAKSVPIESELARRGIKLSRTSEGFAGPCPQCGGTDRFSVNTRKQVFNCRGCGGKGDVIDLVRHIDGGSIARRSRP